MDMSDHIPGYKGEHPLYKDDPNGLFGPELSRLDFIWGYTILETATNISTEDRQYIMSHAALMNVLGVDKKSIGTDNLEGILRTNGERAVLGKYSGQVYEAEIVTEDSIQKLRFLVSEQGRGYLQIKPGEEFSD